VTHCLCLCVHFPSGLRSAPVFLSQGVKAVIAKSFERIHRSNLVGMGTRAPVLQGRAGRGLPGAHWVPSATLFTSHADASAITPGMDIQVTTDPGVSFTATLRSIPRYAGVRDMPPGLPRSQQQTHESTLAAVACGSLGAASSWFHQGVLGGVLQCSMSAVLYGTVCRVQY